MAIQQQTAKLQPDQHRQAGEMLARAFYDDPLSVYLVPNDAKRARVLPWMYERVVRYGSMYDGELLTNSSAAPLAPGASIPSSPLPLAGEGPGVREVNAVAVWLPPGLAHTPITRLVRAGLALAPFKFGLGAMGRFMAANHVERLRAKLAPEPHWYLWLIGVAPERQGHGLGSSLIEPMIARADADAIPCYLETHKERNVTFYERHGYNVVHTGNVAKDGPPYWCLKREPRR